MRKLLCYGFLALMFVLQAVPVLAIDLGFDGRVKGVASTAGYGATTETTFAEIMGIAIKAALSFVGVIFLVLMVYAGYLWFTSQGEDEPIKKAQKIILASVIGLVIVAGAYGVTSLVVPIILDKTTDEGSGDPITAGGAKVSCCNICDKWATESCPPKQQMSENDCLSINGKYEGLVSEEECK